MFETLKALWLKWTVREPITKEIEKVRQDLRYERVLLNIFKSKDYPIFKEYLELKIFEGLTQAKMDKVEVLTNLISTIENQERLVKADEAKLANLERKNK